MKIRLTKKKNSISIRVQAQGSCEGVDLADIVRGMGKESPADCFEPIVKGLAERGYTGGITKETRSSKTVEVHRGTSPVSEPGEAPASDCSTQKETH